MFPIYEKKPPARANRRQRLAPVRRGLPETDREPVAGSKCARMEQRNDVAHSRLPQAQPAAHFVRLQQAPAPADAAPHTAAQIYANHMAAMLKEAVKQDLVSDEDEELVADELEVEVEEDLEGQSRSPVALVARAAAQRSAVLFVGGSANKPLALLHMHPVFVALPPIRHSAQLSCSSFRRPDEIRAERLSSAGRRLSDRHLLFRSGTPQLTQLYLQIQSDSRRDPKTSVSARMPQRLSLRGHPQKVLCSFRLVNSGHWVTVVTSR